MDSIEIVPTMSKEELKQHLRVFIDHNGRMKAPFVLERELYAYLKISQANKQTTFEFRVEFGLPPRFLIRPLIRRVLYRLREYEVLNQGAKPEGDAQVDVDSQIITVDGTAAETEERINKELEAHEAAKNFIPINIPEPPIIRITFPEGVLVTVTDIEAAAKLVKRFRTI